MTSAVSAPAATTTPGSPARGLVCRACGAEYPLVAQHACYECFGPLEVAYDQAALARVTRVAASWPAGSSPAYRQMLFGPASICSRVTRARAAWS